MNKALSGMAGGIAGAAATSLVTGRNFGDTIVSQMPSIIGNTIGNLVADAVSRGGQPSEASKLDENGLLISSEKNRLGGTYKMRDGDTAASISSDMGIKIDDLIRANPSVDFNSGFQLGMEIQLPPADPHTHWLIDICSR